MIDPFVDLYLFWAVLSSIIVALAAGAAVVQVVGWYTADRHRPHRGPGRFARWARTAVTGCRVVVSRYRTVVSR